METLLKQLLEFLSIELTVMLTASLPIIEMRGAIPVGISLGLNPIHAAILAFIGSMIPVPFIFFTIRPIFNYLKGTRAFNRIVTRLTHTTASNSLKIKKYGFLGLILVVAIPLPGTGVWSGTLVATLMNLRFKWAFPAILIGNIIAGVLIMLLSRGLVNLIY